MHIDHYPQMQATNPKMIKEQGSNPKAFNMPKKIRQLINKASRGLQGPARSPVL